MKTMLIMFSVITFGITGYVIPEVLAQCSPELVDELGNCPDVKEYYIETRSPYLQIEHGVNPQDVVCIGDRKLVMKPSNGNPACVYPDSIPKLVERGWQRVSYFDVKQHVEISAIKYRYNQIVNEPITDFYIKIEGTGYNYYRPKLWIGDANNNTVWTNDHISSLHFGRTSPGDFCKEYTFYNIGGPVIMNATGQYTFHMSFEGQTESYALSVKDGKSEKNYPTYGEHCPTTLSEEENGFDNFVLTVSNQSMDRESVDILVQIDDYVVIDSTFEVGEQHNYHDYGFLLTEGNHTIAVKSRGENAYLMQDFTIDGKQWGYLSYQYEEEKNNPRFELIINDKGFAFL